MKRIANIVGGLLAAGLLLSAVTGAVADDLIPAPWRDAADTTFQEATFSQSWDVSWESVSNPYDQPEIWMYSDSWQWDAEAHGRQGVVSWGSWQSGLSMDIPNNEDPNLEKRIWVQITYYGAAPTIWEAVGIMTGGGIWNGVPPLEGLVDHGDGWVTEARQMIIQPNPPLEFVGVRWEGAGMVDQIIVETICVPEPGTLALLAAAGAAGLLCMFRGRKRDRCAY